MWEKYGRAGEATSDSIMLRRRYAVVMLNSLGKNTVTHIQAVLALTANSSL